MALVILSLGAHFARFLGMAVETYCLNAGVTGADALGKVARYALMTFVVMIALNQLEIGAPSSARPS